MTDFNIKNRKEWEQNGVVYTVEYLVEIEIDGRTFERRFKVDPGQSIDAHVEAWKREMERRI